MVGLKKDTQRGKFFKSLRNVTQDTEPQDFALTEQFIILNKKKDKQPYNLYAAST